MRTGQAAFAASSRGSVGVNMRSKLLLDLLCVRERVGDRETFTRQKARGIRRAAERRKAPPAARYRRRRRRRFQQPAAVVRAVAR